MALTFCVLSMEDETTPHCFRNRALSLRPRHARCLGRNWGPKASEAASNRVPNGVFHCLGEAPRPPPNFMHENGEMKPAFRRGGGIGLSSEMVS